MRRSSRIRRLYGAAEADRLALAWAYGVVTGEGGSDAWSTFWSELMDPAWRYVSVANLLNFDSDAEELRFQDGLTIRTRSRAVLLTLLRWRPEVLEQTVGADWVSGSGSAGRYVLVHEDAVAKEPDNIVLSNSPGSAAAINRLLLALRLSHPGDVGIGTVFGTRLEPFPISVGGIHSAPAISYQLAGHELRLPAIEVDEVRRLYAALADFEAHHAPRQQSIVTALSRLTVAYSRPWIGGADRLVDDMIGLEALVGTTGPELSYTLAIRASGLLTDSDSDRVALFERMRSFYATRSRLVHGGSLKSKHWSDIGREPELRDILRRLLRGFLNLCQSTEFYPTPELLERVDVMLLDSEQRTRLGAAMASGPPAQISATPGPRIVAQWADQPPSSATVSVPTSDGTAS